MDQIDVIAKRVDVLPTRSKQPQKVNAIFLTKKGVIW